MENLVDVIIDVALRTSVVYLFLIICIIIIGKTELSQLSIIDLVLVLLISNAVQNAMVGEHTSLSAGLVSAGVLFLLNYTLKLLKFRYKPINALLQGHPVMLIYEGRIQQANMARVKFTGDELLTAVREHGIMDISEVEMAVLETDGNISVITSSTHEGVHKLRKKKLPVKLKRG